MPSELPERLDAEENLWFPGQTAELVASFVARHEYERPLFERYGTARWLAGSPTSAQPVGETVQIGSHQALIEYLPVDTQRLYDGLDYASADNLNCRAELESSFALLNRLPSLADSIGRVVKAVHPLQAPRNHDVSHSTPELPFSVFVSIPGGDELDSTARLAESLIHEAMHLQLTLVDLVEPLAQNDAVTGYSPWKEEDRPVTGLLHGVYVFAVIDQAFSTLAETDEALGLYYKKRRGSIQDEVATLPRDIDGLSPLGFSLWCRCLNAIADRRS